MSSNSECRSSVHAHPRKSAACAIAHSWTDPRVDVCLGPVIICASSGFAPMRMRARSIFAIVITAHPRFLNSRVEFVYVYSYVLVVVAVHIIHDVSIYYTCSS